MCSERAQAEAVARRLGPREVVDDHGDLVAESIEHEADRILAAAAPALLEALEHPLLRELLGELEDGAGGADNARLWALAHSWMDTRDAAIALARGGK